MKKLILSIVVVLSGISLMAQPNGLKLNLEKNKVYRFKSLSEQTVSQTVNGVQQTTNTSTKSAFSMKMMDVTADFIIAEIRFDTMLTTTNAMGKMSVINSAVEGNVASTEAADVMSYFMNKLSKNPLYVKLNPVGKVIDIVNFKMLSDIILKDTGSITGQTAPMTKAQLKNTINDKALKSMVEMFTYNLPGVQVKAGDKWEISAPFSAGGMSLDILTSYKLDDVNNNIAGVTTESSIKASDNAGPLQYPGATITYAGIAGMGKSNLTIDMLTGLILENTSKTHIAGDLNVSVQSMNMTIPLEIDGQSTVSSVQ